MKTRLRHVDLVALSGIENLHLNSLQILQYIITNIKIVYYICVFESLLHYHIDLNQDKTKFVNL